MALQEGELLAGLGVPQPLFGALTLIMAVLKLTVITDWSWWRVSSE